MIIPVNYNQCMLITNRLKVVIPVSFIFFFNSYQIFRLAFAFLTRYFYATDELQNKKKNETFLSISYFIEKSSVYN